MPQHHYLHVETNWKSVYLVVVFLGLLTGIPMLVVFQNLRWSDYKMPLDFFLDNMHCSFSLPLTLMVKDFGRNVSPSHKLELIIVLCYTCAC